MVTDIFELIYITQHFSLPHVNEMQIILSLSYNIQPTNQN
jgi:hypothetical protein